MNAKCFDINGYDNFTCDYSDVDFDDSDDESDNRIYPCKCEDDFGGSSEYEDMDEYKFDDEFVFEEVNEDVIGSMIEDIIRDTSQHKSKNKLEILNWLKVDFCLK